MTPVDHGHVEANGVRYYYEIHGAGEPLLLLHGGMGSLDMFAPMLPRLASERRVIAVDLHGHGRTALGDRPLNLIDIGDDMATILESLGVERSDVLGYSLGGGVAFRLAAQHPERVRRLVLVSAAFARDGYFPELLEQQAQIGADMADAMGMMYDLYAAVAPNPDDFPRLLDEIGALLRQDYDWREDVASLTMPTMLVYGDGDMYRPEHIMEFYRLLGGGLRDAGWMREHMPSNRLAIIPDLTHYEMLNAPELPEIVMPFLDGVTRESRWDQPHGAGE